MSGAGATQALAFNISKAFDRAWLAGLLHKFKSHGISGQIFSLVYSFLSNRQMVSCGSGWEIFTTIFN